eukprot:2973565-Alexandrium_andersonii.AAC.1
MGPRRAPAHECPQPLKVSECASLSLFTLSQGQRSRTGPEALNGRLRNNKTMGLICRVGDGSRLSPLLCRGRQTRVVDMRVWRGPGNQHDLLPRPRHPPSWKATEIS